MGMSVFLWAVFVRFERNADGIVTDLQTNLQWQDDYSDNGGQVKSDDWQGAINYCKDLELGGYSDWRLPNIKELSSIMNDTAHPTIYPVFQTNASGFYYWSSTTAVNFTGAAWYINCDYGNHSYLPKSGGDGRVRCVRTRTAG